MDNQKHGSLKRLPARTYPKWPEITRKNPKVPWTAKSGFRPAERDNTATPGSVFKDATKVMEEIQARKNRQRFIENFKAKMKRNEALGAPPPVIKYSPEGSV